MIESIRSLLPPQHRQEKRLKRDAGEIAYRLSILNSETIEGEAETLKRKGLNVEIVKEPQLHLSITPLNLNSGNKFHIQVYKVYLNPALNTTYVRQKREGFSEDVVGDMSGLEASTRDDLQYLRNTSKKK